MFYIFPIIYFLLVIPSLFFMAQVESSPNPKKVNNDDDLWNNLMNSRFLSPLFHERKFNEDAFAPHGLNTSFHTSSSETLSSVLIDYLKNSKEIHAFSAFSSPDESNSRIFTFFDDPICEILVFSSGLYVCGEANIQTSFTLTSGLNATELFMAKINKPFLQMHLDRCLIHPDTFIHHPTKAPELQHWCYQHLNVKSAHVYVVNQAEFGGNLIVPSLHVEMGARLFVGLRNLIYSSPRLVGPKSAILTTTPRATSTLTQYNSSLARRERLSQVVKASRSNLLGFPSYVTPPIKTFPFVDKRKEKQPETSWNDPSSFRSTRMLNVNHHLFLTKDELLSLRCPLLDIVTGVVQDTFQRVQTPHNVTLDNPSPQTPHMKPRSLSYLKNEHFASQTRYSLDHPFSNNNNPNMFVSRSYSPYSSTYEEHFPPLPEGIPLGDLRVFKNHSVIENGAFVWIYGNFKAQQGIIVQRGAQLYLHCGHLITNIEKNGTGLMVSKGSSVSSGGFLESILPRVILQHGSQLRVEGSLLVTRYLQASSGCVIKIFKELLASFVSLKGAAKLFIHEAVEVETLLDIADGSELWIKGTLAVGYLQILDGSQVDIHQNVSLPIVPSRGTNDDSRKVIVVEDTLLIDCKSTMKVQGVSLLVYSSVFITNSSSLYLDQGDLYLDGFGFIQVVGSQLLSHGNCIAPHGSLLVGFGSIVRIQGDLQTFGVTLLDDMSNDTDYTLPQNWTQKSTFFGTPEDTSTTKAPHVRPALFIEDSQVMVDGTIEILNSWVEISRRATLVVGGHGLLTLQPNKSFVVVHQGSKLLVKSGHLVAGKALILTSASAVEALKETPVVVFGHVDMADQSSLTASRLRTFGDVYIRGDSTVLIDTTIVVGGSMLSIAEHSVVQCQGVRQKRGDIFVTHKGQLLVENGPIWTYGSIISQAGSRVRVRNGSLTAVQGDVVCENFSSLHVDGVLLLFSTLYIKKKMEKRPIDLPPYLSEEALKLPSFTPHENVDPIKSSFPDNANYFSKIQHLAGSLRKTPESILTYSRLIPADTPENVYQQHVQFVTNNTTPSATSAQHTDVQWRTSRTTAGEQQSSLRDKERFIQQLNHPTTWETLNFFNRKT